MGVLTTMLALPTKRAAFLASIAASSVCSGVAFAPQSLRGRRSSSSSSSSLTALSATVDPTVVTKKEYQDICGVDFNDSALADRLARNPYLYPKHFEVINDFTPMVNKMVDEIVSAATLLSVEITRENVWCTKMAALFDLSVSWSCQLDYSPLDVVISWPERNGLISEIDHIMEMHALNLQHSFPLLLMIPSFSLLLLCVYHYSVKLIRT